MVQKSYNGLWMEITNFIDEVYSPSYLAVATIEPKRYMKFYTNIFDYIFIPQTSAMRDYRNNTGGCLYKRLTTYLHQKVIDVYQNVKDMPDEDVLRFYPVYWKNYKRICGIVNGGCHYLNRHRLQSQLENGRCDIYEIKVLAEEIWERSFFQPLIPRITRGCLNLIKMDRQNHSSIRIQSIKDILQLYMNENFNEIIKVGPQFESNNDIYTGCFENEFLREAQDFYHGQQIPSFEENRILEYLTSITSYFDYEINVAYSYLPKEKSTSKKLLDMLKDLFPPDEILNRISNKMKSLVWHENNHSELACLYELISKIPKIKYELIKLMEDYFHQKGIGAIHLVREVATKNPTTYIQTLIDVYKELGKLVVELFHNDQDFIAMVGKICRKITNNNPVIDSVDGTKKMAELLARYCDALLRTSSRIIEQTNVEEKLNQFMIVFNYIDDKDIFLKFYEKSLAKRLVGQLSASDDYEESIISKLKQACGFEYTSKLQRMFQDISVSKTLIVEYEKYCETNQVTDIVDFSVMVLSSNSWPFSAPPSFILPSELKSTFDSFTDFYTHRHNGRKLTWLHQHSKGELQTFFTSQKYILQVSTYQMVILLLFNKVLTWTVEQIQDETQIKLELLQQILFSLLKTKLLISPDIHEDELDEDFKDADIKTNYSIRLADNFKSKKLRINLNVPIKSVEQKDIENVHRTINEDRRMVIQATIVRIMKARQILKHALLMQEVIEQLSSRFKPNVSMIKKCIDILIEKEYVKRDSDDKDTLCYMA